MERMELMLGVVLMVIALLVGVLFGGSSIWYLKPAAGGDKTVEKTVNKYVCSDGSVKNTQSECPLVTISSGGKQTPCPVCQICPSKGTINQTTNFDCLRCSTECRGIIIMPPTTTTLTPPPVCKVCTSSGDCGQASYSEFKCKNDEVYKDYLEPLCDLDNKTMEKCCKSKVTYNAIQTCADPQRCRKGQGCVTIEEAVGD